MSLETVLSNALAWLSGLASYLLIDHVRRKRDWRNAEASLKAEVERLRDAMVLIAFELSLSGEREIGWDFFCWVGKHVDRLPEGDEFRDGVQGLLNSRTTQHDEKLAELVDRSRRDRQDTSPALKSYSMPLMEAALPYLAAAPSEVQKGLVRLRAQVEIFNQQVEEQRYYLRLTFEEFPEPKAHLVARNLTASEAQVAKRAKLIADLAEGFLLNLK